jgi:hypothetical protein
MYGILVVPYKLWLARGILICSFFISESELFYLLTVGADGYCCSWEHSVTHTNTLARARALGRVPLDEWSARRSDLCLTTHNTHKRQTSMPPARFEPAIPARKRTQTHALDGAATDVGGILVYVIISLDHLLFWGLCSAPELRQLCHRFNRQFSTNRKVAGSIPDGVIGIFIDIILSVALWPWCRLSL